MSKKNGRQPARDLLRSSDPLSDDACASLVHYLEEDDLVDFKESFDPAPNSKSWLDLAADCAAFANTHGGYLVFGVRDKTWEQVGLGSETAAALADIKKVLEKVNRGLSPPITGARSRGIDVGSNKFVVLMVPQSPNFTHIFETDLSWKNPKGESISGIRRGTIYTRRSGSNAILTSADFEMLLNRRIQHFRDKVLEGLVRVVSASPAHETLTVAVDQTMSNNVAVRVIEAPPALGLDGKSLSINADSISDKINLMIALTRSQTDSQIDVRLLFGLYAVRTENALNDEQKEWVIYHSLRTEVPAFFWLAEVKESKARDLITAAFESCKFWQRVAILNYAGFFGQRLHEKLFAKLGPAASEHRIRPFQNKQAVFNVSRSTDPNRDSSRATTLARLLAINHDAQSKNELRKLDCSLYAPFD